MNKNICKAIALALAITQTTSCVKQYVKVVTENTEEKEIRYRKIEIPSFDIKMNYGYGKQDYVEITGMINEAKEKREITKKGKAIHEYTIKETKNCAKAVANYSIMIPFGIINVGFCVSTLFIFPGVAGWCYIFGGGELAEKCMDGCFKPIMSITEKWNFRCKRKKEILKDEQKEKIILEENEKIIGVEATGKKYWINDYINVKIEELGIDKKIKLEKGKGKIAIPSIVNYTQLDSVVKNLDCDTKKVFDTIEEKVIDAIIEYKNERRSYDLTIKSNDLDTIRKAIDKVCK